jgi:hypothetical protein
MESILSYLWSAVLATLLQIGIFLVPGIVLAFILNFESGFVERRALATLGRGWYLGLFGWLGTIVHELGHALFCLIFRHKITAIKLFDPDPETGTLGYVEHTYTPTNLYQLAGNFFIGIGPILLGTAIICLLAYFLLGFNPFKLAGSFNITLSHIDSWNIFLQLLSNLWTISLDLLRDVFSWHNLSTWQFYAFIYLVFAIGSSITLSPPDIKGALKGFSVILVLIFIFNLGTVWAVDFASNLISGTAGYFAIFYAAIFLTLILNTIIAVLLLLLLSFKRKT